MNELAGLVVLSVRCAGPGPDDWDSWARGPHLDTLRSIPGVGQVSRSALVPPPVMGMPGPGFSHVELIELVDDIDAGVASVRAGLVSERGGDRGRTDHAVVAGEVLAPHGDHRNKAAVDDGLTGHIVANVLCTDRDHESDWDRWYDDQHLPDMMASGAFIGGSRWRRRLRPQWGAAHVTLYDIGLSPVTEAVDRSAAVMPDLVAQGRKHPHHCGATTLLLERAE
ncbi:MAG: hypothetical protein ACR2QE_20225 [Acidimicrobiales bacterium]